MWKGSLAGNTVFLRRAILADKNLHLVTLLRQADGKFLRQGVESASTLEKGFPNDKAELFQYKAIILGSVEASFFTFDQLRMISDFVSQRGGGFLMLGGKNSFGQGGYINTPLEDMLPLNLGPDAAASSRISGSGIQGSPDPLWISASDYAGFLCRRIRTGRDGNLRRPWWDSIRPRTEAGRDVLAAGQRPRYPRAKSRHSGFSAFRQRQVRGIHHRLQLALENGAGAHRTISTSFSGSRCCAGWSAMSRIP